MNTIAAIGVALQEAAQPSFKTYAARVIENAKTLARALIQRGFVLVSGGTDNHLLLIDLTPTGVGRGKFFQLALESVNLYTNMNTVPGDQGSAIYPSGLRLGTPAATTRGLGVPEMEQIADWIQRIAGAIKDDKLPTDKALRAQAMQKFSERIEQDASFQTIRHEVETLCQKFPLPT